MSDLLAAAAVVQGMPEALVKRSAEARAAQTGQSVDEILAAWAGGAPEAGAKGLLGAAAGARGMPEALVKRSAEARAAETGESVDDVLLAWAAADAEPAEAGATPVSPPAGGVEAPLSPPFPVATVPYKAPVLVGARDTTMSIIVGAVGLFLVVLLVGLVGPSIPMDSPGARTSEIAYSQAALDGKTVYGSLGCAACHTQMVRPVIADVGLGLVTLNDSNQTVGVRRFGPDLSDVGSRMSPGEIEALASGDSGDHPPHTLDEGDMSALVSYLVESRTATGS